MTAGRPTKYKPEYCQELIDFCAQGYSLEAFCGHIDVSKETLYTWFETHQEFLDAKVRGLQKSRMFWEKLGIDHIVSKSDSETIVQGKDKITTSKSRTLNASVWALNMKNRFAWKDNVDVNQTSNAKIEIVIDQQDEKL